MALPPGHGSMDVGKADALTPTPKVDAEIAKLEKSGKSKKELASLYAARGSSRMMDEHASPKVKYRAALQDYRQALKADPTNKEAQQNKALIESIYQGMGRPVPQ
jgi:tetratricopeptide (TPR) repeat protein